MPEGGEEVRVTLHLRQAGSGHLLPARGQRHESLQHHGRKPLHCERGCVGQYTSCCDACGQSGCATTTTTTTASTTTQRSVCGNGVIEAGEWCDGEEFCEPNCTIRRFACCELTTPSGGACSATVPAFTLLVDQHGACGVYGGTFRLGRVAASAEPCADPVTTGPSPSGRVPARHRPT